MKEAAARIKINKLLEAAGWRFFADGGKPANIQLELAVTLTEQALNELGENFEKTKKGFVDFLLLNAKGFPLIVLEAKTEGKNPLSAKEQARTYAKSQNCRFVTFPTAIFITSGTWNEAIPTSLPPSPRRHRLLATKRVCPTRSALLKKTSVTITSP